MTRLLGMTLCAGMLLVSASSFAGGQAFEPAVEVIKNEKPFEPNVLENNGRWLIGVMGGIDATMFDDDVLSLNTLGSGFADDTFTMSDMSKVDGVFGFNVGYEWQRDESDQHIGLMLEYDHFANIAVRGNRVALASLTSSYHYKVKRQALLFIMKAGLFKWHSLLPYLEAGAGMSQNKFSDFSNPGAAGGTTITAFPNNTSYQFSAVVGAGFDWMATQNARLGIGYRFGYWGDIESGVVNNASGGGALPSSIRLAHTLYSNEVDVTATYLFA